MSHPPADRDVLEAVKWCHRVKRMRNLSGDAVVADAILLSAIVHEAATVSNYTSHVDASLPGGDLSVAVPESSGVLSVTDIVSKMIDATDGHLLTRMTQKLLHSKHRLA